MKASKIFHRDEYRIKLEFPYNTEIVEKLRQIPDTRWSQTNRAWHIPYTIEAFEQLKRLFPDVEYSKNAQEIKREEIHTKENQKDPENKSIDTQKPEEIKNSDKQASTEKKFSEITIEVIGRRIFLKMPKNNTDVQFVRSFRFFKWDQNSFCWIIPNYPGNLELLKDYFKERVTSLLVHSNYDVQIGNSNKRNIGNDDVLLIRTKNGRLKIIYAYDIELTQIIKKLPYRTWDAQNKWWSIPYSDIFLAKIKEVIQAKGKHVLYEEEPVNDNKKARITPFDIPNYRTCPNEYLLKLKELRYSERTLKTYKGLFEEFINYYHKFDISSIEESMITAFLRYLVMERKVSASYQNQSINAIKFYYERVLGGQRKVYCVDRPREEKALPVVLSEEEVIQIFHVTKNMKHKAILMITYSAGLRLSEIINLKINDIDSDRMQIRVEQSKGKKDRYTLLSSKVLEILRSYIAEYKPKTWLFEGVKPGEKYSQASVQAIVKDAVKVAKIKKRVTVHTLRHSFATHLLESGTDLRYIQSLLGHESTRTTEVYTHITTKGFEQIKSPIDKLNI